MTMFSNVRTEEWHTKTVTADVAGAQPRLDAQSPVQRRYTPKSIHVVYVGDGRSWWMSWAEIRGPVLRDPDGPHRSLRAEAFGPEDEVPTWMAAFVSNHIPRQPDES